MLTMGRDFKKLNVWNTSYELLLMVYDQLDNLPSLESRNVTDQMRRAATSIPLNIAEGAGAHSNKVFLNHLNHAYKSAKELEVLFLLCVDVSYFSKSIYDTLSTKLELLKASLFKFMIQVEREIKIGMNNFSYDRRSFGFKQSRRT